MWPIEKKWLLRTSFNTHILTPLFNKKLQYELQIDIAKKV